MSKYNQTKQIKKETEMKTPNTKKTIIVTVVVTLAVLAAFAGQALYFYNLGQSNKAAYNAQVKTEAAAMVGSLKHSQK